ncbi:MAG: hypothetical protein J6M18_02060, partial [Actinomycetaceae bacterium]|nr:hypothetical protein [Actinomycetaceae bacterium]
MDNNDGVLHAIFAYAMVARQYLVHNPIPEELMEGMEHSHVGQLLMEFMIAAFSFVAFVLQSVIFMFVVRVIDKNDAPLPFTYSFISL